MRRGKESNASMTPKYLNIMVLLRKRVYLITFVLFDGCEPIVKKLTEDEVNVCLGPCWSCKCLQLFPCIVLSF